MSNEPGAPSEAPRLLILGHVTRDLMPDGSERLGGAASYAAWAASALGVRAGVVTVAPPATSLLAALQGLPGVQVAVSPSTEMTTFALDYSGPRRRLVLREVARPLRLDDVPPSWRSAPVVYSGPIAGECGRELLDAFDGAHVIAGFQGWLRRAAPDGTVEPALLPEAVEPPRALRVASLSEEDHPQAEAMATKMASRGIVAAVTRGRRGATILHGAARWEVTAVPAREVEATGAGDVFALVLGLSLWEGASIEEAGRRAAAAAARVVEGPGIGTLGGPAAR